ncbi:monooxygenase FAD-binding [Parafrankia sp. EAN1pec]|uniref:FAD-binding monooxygenase n=1 Tax=Parafrankia sp. (strain EAN1pec) TaxID=298653 RepID=UPI00015D9D51|nr:monooxygenase FAD-binding [Frankia sp. EAN1pec]
MRIVCVGGGPAGLYFAISAKRRDAGHEITIIDRDPPGATYGWGVVYWDNLLDVLFRNDPDSAREIRGASTLWQEQDISLGSERAAHFAGYGFSVQRAALLDILTRRAEELGVRVEHDREVADLTDLADLGCLGGLGAHADADLVIAADGANSQVRSMFADRFGTRVDTGGNRYIWLGTPRRFERFTFAFEPTPAGWVWFHAYPSGAEVSTCIVECAPRTWDALGLGTDDGEGLRLLGKIFAGPLAGEGLIDQLRRPARWQRFGQVSNRSWYWDNMVLLGDAAHTTHFTLGSGTALAMMDGVMLAQMLYEHGEVPVALAEFDRAGRAALAPLQARARTSMAWFERIDGQLDRARPATGGDPDPVAFAYAMATRQGDQPPWRYQAHRAMQVGAVRRLRREVDSSVRWYLARRRGEPARPAGRPAPAGTPTPAGPAGRALAGAGSGSAAHRSRG